MNISTYDRPLTDVDVDATDSSESGRNVNSTRSAKSPLTMSALPTSPSIQTKIPPSIWLPAMEIAWSVLTIVVARVKNVETLYALPFFIGLFEASTYADIMTLLGNCIIVIPIAMYGFWAIPDAPTTSRSRWLKPAQKEPAIARMKVVGRKPAKPVTLRTFKAIFTAWPVYIFTLTFIRHFLGIRIYSYFNV
ncbi:hypothetical protein DL95DRAFT_472618 [Leptodontidium sp. 2 PMI_412]|nr:hypothetical protein DL95DRAFT_472618 [Leptodontidium sp. 2 PMI_412]